MKRRSFLKLLGAATAATAIPVAVASPKQYGVSIVAEHSDGVKAINRLADSLSSQLNANYLEQFEAEARKQYAMKPSLMRGRVK